MYLNKILIDGELEEDWEVIATHLEELYTNLYKETSSWRPRLEWVVLEEILEEKRWAWEEWVLEEEVCQAISTARAGRLPPVSVQKRMKLFEGRYHEGGGGTTK